MSWRSSPTPLPPDGIWLQHFLNNPSTFSFRKICRSQTSWILNKCSDSRVRQNCRTNCSLYRNRFQSSNASCFMLMLFFSLPLRGDKWLSERNLVCCERRTPTETDWSSFGALLMVTEFQRLISEVFGWYMRSLPTATLGDSQPLGCRNQVGRNQEKSMHKMYRLPTKYGNHIFPNIIQIHWLNTAILFLTPILDQSLAIRMFYFCNTL